MLFNREPSLIMGAIGALIALGVGFGLPVTPLQVGLIMAAVSAVIAVIVRQNVTPVETANKQIEVALTKPATTPVEEVVRIAAKQP